MTVRDVKDVLGARVLAGEEFLDREVKSACGSDMMSDVLAFSMCQRRVSARCGMRSR